MTTPPPDATPGTVSAGDPNSIDGAQLPCGAQVDDLLEQVADGYADDLTTHERGCVHCQATLAELTDLWAPVHAAARTPVAVPDGLTTSIMASVRRRVRDTWFTFEAAEGGAIRIAARIVAVVARDTARRVPGVRVVLGRTSESRMAAIVEKATLGHRHPHSAVGVLGRTAAVDLAVAVTYGEPAPDVARAIQRDVIAALRRDIGVTGVQVNVTVDDVLPDAAA